MLVDQSIQMKHRNIFFRPLAFAFFLSLFLVGCHHPKTISKTDATNGVTPNTVVKPIDAKVYALLSQLKSNQILFTELAAKLKTKVSSPSLNQSFTTNIRWKKGDRIWMSMSIIGIEGARVLITRDSIKIMDKINERYILKPLSYIKEKTFVDLSFSDIENLLLGQLIFTDTSKAKYADNPANIMISADGVQFLTDVVFDKSTKNLSSIFVKDKLHPQTVSSTYNNYETQLGKPFSMDRYLEIKSGPETFSMDAKFQSIEIRQNLEYPFAINPGYTIEK